MAKFRQSRKGNIFDGPVPGISYNKFRSTLTPPLGSPNAIGYHHDIYMHGNPREYRPNINAPSIDWNDYEIYEPLNANHSLHKDTEMQFHAREISPDDFNLVIPQDELTMTERLLQAMGKRNAEKCISNIVSEIGNNNSDGFVNSNDSHDFVNLVSAITQLSKVFPQDHPDIINLRKAFSEMINDPDRISKFEALAGDIKPSKLGRGNPYERDTCEQAVEEYNRQIELFEQPSGQLSSEPAIEQMSNIPISEPFSDEQTLEDIVSEEDVSLKSEPQLVENDMLKFSMNMAQHDEMAIEEIDNAIDKAMEQPLFQVPKPIQEENPFLIAQQMFNQQMQFMNNSFMMPGP
jgi:hypothetical protein